MVSVRAEDCASSLHNLLGVTSSPPLPSKGFSKRWKISLYTTSSQQADTSRQFLPREVHQGHLNIMSMASKIGFTMRKLAIQNLTARHGGSRLMSSVINLSDLDATEKFRSINDKSILYFTASWCGPCKAIKPIYEEMSAKYPDISFGKVDVDDNGEAAMEFEISAVPTFVSFEGETIVERFAGADPSKLELLAKELDSR